MNSITIDKLNKSYGDNYALCDVSLCFEENKIYGLLGRNGAGKSTLLNAISNRIFTDSGDILIDGQTAVENDTAQQKLYLMSEKTYYPESMKLKDAIRWSKEFYPNFDEKYAFSIAKQFELNLNKKVKALSTGFLSIFKLVIALSVNTPYLFLDEPVLGLDANNRELFYRLLIKKYSSSPFTVVISTHLIDEVANVIEEIVMIKNGRIICNEPLEQLIAKGYSVTGSISTVDAYLQGKEVIGTSQLGNMKMACLMGTPDKTNLDGLEIGKMGLQELFIQLTNT